MQNFYIYSNFSHVIRGVHAFARVLVWHITQPRCVSCRRLIDLYRRLCADCLARITPVVSKSLSITQNYEIRVWAAGSYEGPLRDLVLATKNKDVFAARVLGEIVVKQSGVETQSFDYIIPVPLHWTRYAQRGYNQAEEMAAVISRRFDKPVLNIIKRNKKTQFQSLLSFDQKLQNVKNAFTLKKNSSMIEGKAILLVDDVLTSGSTLKAMIQELRKAKPALIIAVVGARAV